MAEAFTNHLARERGLSVRGLSAGTVGGNQINPVAAQVMEEMGVSLDKQRPKLLTPEMVKEADAVITMGCGVDAACPARFILTADWGLDDPKGGPIGEVRAIRDEIKQRVAALLAHDFPQNNSETGTPL